MKFEVGKNYWMADDGFGYITVLARTNKYIKVKNKFNIWKMLIRVDENGNEYLVDSSVSKKFQEVFTYSAEWEVK